MSDHEFSLFTAASTLLIAIGCLIAGFAGAADYFPFSFFFLAATILLAVPTLWHVATKR